MSKKKKSTKTPKPKNGKGDSPRNIFSKDYIKNYDNINWKKKKP
jgi:hypothetical protein